MEPTFCYAATVVRWVDGDTVDLRIDLGFYMTAECRFRLHGIDTPERGQRNHDEATAHCQSLAPPGTTVTAQTYKVADKYGRWLAVLHVGDVSINQSLIEHQLAVPYFGGTKQKPA